MRNLLFFLTVILTSAMSLQAQRVIPLYKGKAAGSENWNWSEKSNDKNMWNTSIVYNVTDPSLTLFEPPKGKANGTAVIIVPGGGFQALSITKEGYDVAKWMAEKGITAFVLKYRLNKSETDDPIAEFMKGLSDPLMRKKINDTIIPMDITDGRNAIAYVRTNAKSFGINTDKIGIMGFSAGGTVTLGATLDYDATNKPNFSAPIYPYASYFKNVTVPPDAPPMFICAATDDMFGFAPDCANLYNTWIKAKKPAEIHIYEKGGHGFGMAKQNLPSDKWINLFADWLVQNGMMEK
jgi:acetyl esterase/lipase